MIRLYTGRSVGSSNLYVYVNDIKRIQGAEHGKYCSVLFHNAKSWVDVHMSAEDVLIAMGEIDPTDKD